VWIGLEDLRLSAHWLLEQTPLSQKPASHTLSHFPQLSGSIRMLAVQVDVGIDVMILVEFVVTVIVDTCLYLWST
jgi:hypothetical protein